MSNSIQLKLDKWSHGGEGLAFEAHKPIFVPGGVPGDVVEAHLISEKKQYSRALIDNIIEAGPSRVEPPCPHYVSCGGCQWQHANYPEQLLAKRQLLIETLHKVGGWDTDQLEEAVEPVLGMENPWAYRNKAQFPVQNIDGEVTLGFYKPRSHELIPVDHCMIQHDKMNALLVYLQEKLRELDSQGLRAYNEAEHKGVLRHVVLRHGFKTNETMVGFVVTKKTPWFMSLFDTFAAEIMERFPEVKGVVINKNSKRTNRILGDDTTLIAGQAFYTDQLGDLKFDVSLPAFFQVNPAQAEKLYSSAAKFFQRKEGLYNTVLDAYSGAGTLSLWLASVAKQVIGVESNPNAVANARENAIKNNVSGVRFIEDRVENVIASCIEEVDAMLVDPPRKGCDPKVLEAFIASDIPQLVYISCNPATLARDSKILKRAGFKLSACQPVDMFPQTHHLETVSCFVR